MCRIEQCIFDEYAERDALKASEELLDLLSQPKSLSTANKIAARQAVIMHNDPRLVGMAEQEFAAIHMELYNKHIEVQAENFLRQIVIVDVGATCPI